MNAYLLVGGDSALLIDTGNGSGNITAVVEVLTERPVRVIATHGHADHLGGAGWFDEVLIHEADLAPVYRRSSGAFASRVAAKLFGVAYHHTKKPHKARFAPISLPFEVDLGSRRVKAVHLPGHTAGSIGLWDEENHQIFCGDAVGTNMQMMSPGTLSLEVLAETISRRLVLAKDNTVWWGHFGGQVTEADLVSLQQEVQGILQEQPRNTKCGTVKTSRNKLITYKTSDVHGRKT